MKETANRGASTLTSRGRDPRVVQLRLCLPDPTRHPVHEQRTASVRIKSATLPTDTGEKNEPAGGVAEFVPVSLMILSSWLKAGDLVLGTCQQWWS